MANYNRALIKQAIATKFEERGDDFDLFCKDEKRLYINPAADGEGYFVTLEKPAGQYWDSDYQAFITTFKIEAQARCLTKDAVGEFIAEIFSKKL